MAPGPADLPDPVVGLLPALLDELDQCPLQVPHRPAGHAVELTGRVQGRHDLAVHVELVLPRRRVADADRLGVLVATQPVHLPLVEAALAGRAVHDLQARHVPGGGPEQPVPPGHRLLVVAAPHEGLERQGRVAQPAVPVVPVAVAPDRLGERGRGSGHHAPGRLVGERLQGDERTEHGVPVVAVERAPGRPGLPPGCGGLDRVPRVNRAGWQLVGEVPGEGERNLLTLRHREVRQGPHVLAAVLRPGPQGHRVRSRRRREEVLATGHPGQHLAVAEADAQLHPHVDPAREALDDPHHLGMFLPDRHAVGQLDGA